MKNTFKKLAISGGLAALALPSLTLAASPFLKPVKDLLGDAEVFINFLNWALPAIAMILFFLVVIYFIWRRRSGAEITSNEKWTLVWVVVGLAVMFTVYGLIQLIGSFFGIDTNRAKTITAPALPQVGGTSRGGYYSNGTNGSNGGRE